MPCAKKHEVQVLAPGRIPVTGHDVRLDLIVTPDRVIECAHPSGDTPRPGVRWDGGIEPGNTVGLHYDSLLGKLIAWAGTREQAIERMRRALHELRVVGVETSREFHLRVMEDEEYRRGDVNIQWLEQRLPNLVAAPVPESEMRLAAVAAALLADRDRGVAFPISDSRFPIPASRFPIPDSPDPWRDAARRDALR